MEVNASVAERIPAENLRVSRAEFAAVWAVAERYQAEQGRRGVSDWYGAGVVVTCRWLAQAVVPPSPSATPGTAMAKPRLAHAPVTGTTRRAYPELIEAEVLAAELLDMRRPSWLTNRPGWSESIVATFNWVWRRTAGPPVVGPAQRAAG